MRATTDAFSSPPARFAVSCSRASCFWALLPPTVPAADKINTKIADFQFQGADGKPVSLYALKDKKAVVVVFLSFDCPVSASYAPVLAQMSQTYAEKGVAFLAVDGGDEGDATAVAKRAEEYKLPFPVLADPRHGAADALHARTTPEAFVLDATFFLRYRGRIDDGYAARLKRNREITHFDLRTALDEMLAGKDVTTPVTKAIGCPIATDGTGGLPSAAGAGHLRTVMACSRSCRSNCQQCHRARRGRPDSR